MARGVEIRSELSDGLPSIEADPDQLQQVFINLINNSLDAMPLGGELRVSTIPATDSVIIEVSDNGEGIANGEIDLIFDPLFSTKNGRGTGLGLSIVRQIISEHSGEVGVTSEPGRQTTFRIRLPLNPVLNGAEQVELAAKGSASTDQ
jgi:two-component system NtrC family sensor kinase